MFEKRRAEEEAEARRRYRCVNSQVYSFGELVLFVSRELDTPAHIALKSASSLYCSEELTCLVLFRSLLIQPAVLGPRKSLKQQKKCA